MSMKHFAARVFVVMALATPIVAQDQEVSQDPWAPVRSLEGIWEGEGFVNTFKLEEVAGPKRGLNFEPVDTEGMETMSARMTLRFIDAETYEMVLELGTKGKELKPCQTMNLNFKIV